MSEEQDLEVLFSANNREELLPLPGQLIITPSEDSWNDFNYHIRCSYKVCINEEITPHEGNILIGFLPFTDNDSMSREKYEQINLSLYQYLRELNVDGFALTHTIPPFFTMQLDMQGYRSLVESQGQKASESVLKAVNDLVYFKNKQPKWFTDAQESKVFQLGFMRNSEPFFAFHNADSILDGVENENLSSISNDLKLSFKLEGFAVPHSLHLRFNSESLIPRRIAVLIGKNGLGKSESLKAFCRGALQYDDKGLELLDINGERPLISRILAMATPGETSNTFPIERRKNQKLHYRRLNLTRKGTRTIANALVQIARSRESIGKRSRWDLFAGALAQALPFENIHVRLKDGEHFPLRKLRKPGGEQHSLEVWGGLLEGADPVFKVDNNHHPLSSGQLTFLKFALMSCLHIENGSFVLMDEPETHMHPNMISDFVGLLDEILEFTGSFAILSTHSAYFVREVAREQVHIYKKENQHISITQPRLRTFGADVDSISQFVFEEDIESKLTDKIFEKIKGRTFDSVEKQLGEELSLAALMDLQSRLEN
ncbi:AAA family ATPase [Paraglaciecola sp. 25GB23A]|uniref:AAA family ATPase n=1 Tax=Paraglaciecola sp. 25GB23A TaxID=3156068 RepID=UPI0032AF386B